MNWISGVIIPRLSEVFSSLFPVSYYGYHQILRNIANLTSHNDYFCNQWSINKIKVKPKWFSCHWSSVSLSWIVYQKTGVQQLAQQFQVGPEINGMQRNEDMKYTYTLLEKKERPILFSKVSLSNLVWGMHVPLQTSTKYSCQV